MTDIYDQHAAAFRNVSAFVIARNGERVATIAFKFPKDGAGRLYAYVQWFGAPMVRGHANGYGYDKRTAACSAAAKRMTRIPGEHIDPHGEEVESQISFMRALDADRGPTWDSALRAVGFQVWQAV